MRPRLMPGRQLSRHLAAWTLVGLGAAIWPSLVALWAVHGLGLLAFLVWDGRAVRRLPEVRLERRVGESLALGTWAPVRLRLVHDAAKPLRLEVFDHSPPTADVEGLPRALELEPQAGVELEYRIRPLRRGEVSFGRVELYLQSPAGLWRERRWGGGEAKVRVLPDFKPVARYALLALGDRLGQMGIRLQQRRGEGLEFSQLREYRVGDSQRRIDWKATSRRQTLISREYQEEKNQQVVMLVDCGRRLRAVDGELSHFDHVLNAALLLAWVALAQGDVVGLMTMSGSDRWLKPQRGRVAMSAVLRSLYDLETTTAVPDYLEAATRLLARQSRRCLVVVLTNLRDEDAGELLPALRLLSSRHLVLLASLREAVLAEIQEAPVASFRDALRTTAVERYLEARARVHEAVRGRGVLVVDSEPEHLAIQVVNRYLDVKRSGRL